jgi:signal transduction histidine kinase
MKVGTDRIHQIVLSLRNFSRLDESDMKPVDIHEGIDNTLMILQNRLKAKGESPEIEVIKEYGTLPPVECYPGQLNQVFMNLISNAIDALEEGRPFQGASSVEALALAKRGVVQRLEEGAQTGESSTLAIAGEGFLPLASRSLPCIHICTEANGNRVVIRITDNGAGMTEEVKQQLFNPFFTTKPVGKGTGLGLSISYQIVVEKHGGELHCFSVPGQGTQFIIEIPIEHPPE